MCAFLVSPITSSCLGQSAVREAIQCHLCALPRDICSTKCLFSHRRETTASNQPSLIQCSVAYLRSLHLLVYSFWGKMCAETLPFSIEAPMESLLTPCITQDLMRVQNLFCSTGLLWGQAELWVQGGALVAESRGRQ